MNLGRFRTLPLMGILRDIETREVRPIAELSSRVGVTTLEVAMNSSDAADKVYRLREASDGRLMIGAGTVTSLRQLEDALAAGASFVVTPVFVADVVRRCVELSIPVFPGALTPREVFEAARAGAAMVKVFPARVFGPEYFRELRGPFPDIELMACGGVRVDDIREYLRAGARAVAVGPSVFRREWLQAGDFASVESVLRGLVEACLDGLDC